MSANPQAHQMQIQVEQLRREAGIKRIPVSKAAADLIRHIEANQSNDILMNGFANAKDNPFKEKSSCVIL